MSHKRRRPLGPFLESWECAIRVPRTTAQRLQELTSHSDAVRSLALLVWWDADPRDLARLTLLEELYLTGWKYPTLEPFRSLRALRRLTLNVRGRITDLAPLADSVSLEALELTGIRHVRDISPLGSLPKLQHLYIMDLPAPVRLDSIDQLGGLRALVTLDLCNVAFRRGSLRSLADLKALRTLHVSSTFPAADCAWLSTRLPHAECWLFKPTYPLDDACAVCGGSTVLLIGRRRGPFACVACDAERIQRHVARFETYRRAAVAELEKSNE